MAVERVERKRRGESELGVTHNKGLLLELNRGRCSKVACVLTNRLLGRTSSLTFNLNLNHKIKSSSCQCMKLSNILCIGHTLPACECHPFGFYSVYLNIVFSFDFIVVSGM